MIERILVAVDSEGLAAEAARRGVELAGALDAKLSLVHAVDVPPPLWPGIDEAKFATMHAEGVAAERAKTIEQLGPVFADSPHDLEQVLHTAPGPTARVILHHADEWNADLLILGPHAKRNLFDFGTTARAVLSRARIPVWVQSQPVGAVKSILVAVDFSEHSKKALTVADALATSLGASLRVLACYVPPGFAYSENLDADSAQSYVIEFEAEAMQKELANLLDEFPWRGKRASGAFARKDPITEIPRAAESDDLIVMGTHGRSGVSRFLLGSVAYGVLKRATKPVLVVPDATREWVLDGGE